MTEADKTSEQESRMVMLEFCFSPDMAQEKAFALAQRIFNYKFDGELTEDYFLRLVPEDDRVILTGRISKVRDEGGNEQLSDEEIETRRLADVHFKQLWGNPRVKAQI